MSKQTLELTLKIKDDGSIVVDKARGKLDDLGKTADKVSAGPLTAFRENWQKITLGLAAITGSIYGIERLAAAIYRMGQATAAYGDEIQRNSAILEMTNKQYQEFQYMAMRADVSAEALSMGMKMLARSVGDAQKGSKEAQAVFDAMGIKITDTSGKVKTMEELLRETADQFATWKEGPEKIAVALQLFGRSGEAMLPMLNRGSKGLDEFRQEFNRLGLAISDEGIQKLAKADESFERFGAQLKTFKTMALIPVVDKMGELLDIFTQIASYKPPPWFEMMMKEGFQKFFLPPQIRSFLEFWKILEKINPPQYPAYEAPPLSAYPPPSKKSPPALITGGGGAAKQLWDLGGGIPSWLDVVERYDFDERLKNTVYWAERYHEVQKSLNKALLEGKYNTESWLDALEKAHEIIPKTASVELYADLNNHLRDTLAYARHLSDVGQMPSWLDKLEDIPPRALPDIRELNLELAKTVAHAEKLRMEGQMPSWVDAIEKWMGGADPDWRKKIIIQEVSSWEIYIEQTAKNISSIWGGAFGNMKLAMDDFGEWGKRVFADLADYASRELGKIAANMLIFGSAFGEKGGTSYFGTSASGWGGLFGGILKLFKLGEGGRVPGPFVPIQAFGDGARVTRPTLGFIAERGEPEWVIPESKMGSRSVVNNYATYVNYITAMDARSMAQNLKGPVNQIIRKSHKYRGMMKHITG